MPTPELAMLIRPTTRLGRRLAAIALAACIMPAASQTFCRSSSEPSLCDGGWGLSHLQRVGDVTHISRSDGSTATLHRHGDFSVVNDSRPEMSGTMAHYGDLAVFSTPGGSIYCITLGEMMWCT